MASQTTPRERKPVNRGGHAEDPELVAAATPQPVLKSRIRLPRQVTATVGRPRLEAVLSRSASSPVTLVSGPAGYGKTTLIANWVRNQPTTRACAWVSLDERDRDAWSFWTYVLVAVERVAPGTATRAISQLASHQGPDEAVLDDVLNELSVLRDDVLVVLDDYNLCDGPGVQPGMTFLLDHLPPQVHVIISTRADPALPLARLRARGELVEIRTEDLRFTRTETTTYLNDLNSLELDSSAVAALDARAEGWVAALQLAAISLRGRTDSTNFIAEFAGNDRFVLDYLADEVLSRLPDAARRFLLETSILERLTGSLCDAVTASGGGKATLEALERQNLFVVPLDGQRRWYRYHHLFADVLNAHLLDELPEEAPQLHRRASNWFAEHHDWEAAVRHALAAGDIERAAELVELAVPELRRKRGESLIRRWAAGLPPEAVKNRPVLAVCIVGALMASNEFDGARQRLDDVEPLMAGRREDLVIVDQAEFARLPAVIETYRAALALIAGDLPATMTRARTAIDKAADDDLLSIAAASALIGLASWAQGDVDAAHQGYSIAADHLGRAEYIADVLGCTITLADIEVTQGRLRVARRTVENALTLAEHSAGPDVLRGTADMHVALSAVALEQGDLDETAEHLRRADELGDAAALPQNAYRWRVAMARLREAEGDPVTAIELLDEAERVYVADFSPNVRPIAATRARLLAAVGRRDEALAWANSTGVTAADALSYLHEYEHISLARILLAAHTHAGDTFLTDAVGLLERLTRAAETGGRNGSLIEVLILHSLACHAASKHETALASLERAARLAEPEGYFRLFTSEGPALAVLLTALSRRNLDWSFPSRLAAAVPRPGRTPGKATTPPGSSAHDVPPGSGSDGPATPPSLIDPMSVRELDVLRYLGTELAGPAIARELSVSLSTVRTHTQHIYTKLGVNNRRAAIRRAHQLGLFRRAPGS